ncbi:SLC13 family permease [Confluentibacter sediminis]|uniref:SLC13 family permease n=1 Tax=Confluentibacter sediminis TaxID=2219045 RepID=UPI000DAEAE4B|nr:SLC13 family permease [Confluentibacter sediminis]
MDLYITVGIIVIGIFLFIRDYFSIDTTSILIMTLFIVSGVLNPEEGFSGFNHPATLTLGCMFVVSAAVFKSGLIDGLSAKIVKIAKIHYVIALIAFCLISATFSAFVNDSAIVAILIPLALSVCRDTGIAPSKLLIPISFAALFGGTCTLIGTSTNILVSSIAAKSGLEPFGMFEFSLPALCLLGIGMLYLFIIAPFILPKTKTNEANKFASVEKYTAEIRIEKGNKDIDKPIYKSYLSNELNVTIMAIYRNGSNLTVFDRESILKEGDQIKIIISPSKLSELKSKEYFKIVGKKDKENEENTGKILYETMVPVGSILAGTSLRKMQFRNLYNCSVLAIRHRNEVIQENISDVIIKAGDMLLIYGTKEELEQLLRYEIVILLSEYMESKVNYKKAIPALIIAIGVVTAAAFNLTSILISSMVGALLLVTTSILKPKEAYDAIEWKVIFMMAGVLSMGTALEKTGGSEIISEFVFNNMGHLDPRITLSLIFLITFISTNILSSKATAALMVPIVISLAAAMQISEKPFLIGVMFACSLTFMTPMSYPTNTMVYAPGNYKFSDFLKVGTPLNLIIWIAASFIIPLFFPF